jgi:hypothetical protein
MIARTQRPEVAESRDDSADEESAACAVLRLCDDSVASIFPPPLSGLKRIKAINVGLAYSVVRGVSRRNCARFSLFTSRPGLPRGAAGRLYRYMRFGVFASPPLWPRRRPPGKRRACRSRCHTKSAPMDTPTEPRTCSKRLPQTPLDSRRRDTAVRQCRFARTTAYLRARLCFRTRQRTVALA